MLSFVSDFKKPDWFCIACCGIATESQAISRRLQDVTPLFLLSRVILFIEASKFYLQAREAIKLTPQAIALMDEEPKERLDPEDTGGRLRVGH